MNTFTGRSLRPRRRPRASTLTDREFIQWMRDQCDAQLATDPDGGDTESPTGRAPKLVWTPALQRTYNRMRDEGEAGDDTLGGTWYRLIKSNAQGNRYGDSGLWATLMFQITGDPQWIDQAWRKIQAMLDSALDDDNNTRELAAERVILLDWLWPGLTDDRRDQMFVALDRMFTNAATPAVRTTDSDQTTGVYMGIAFYHLAFGDVHPRATELFSLPGVGGLDATARDRSTMRNAILDFVEMAAGGEWIESSEYNLGTVRHLVLGATGIQTATGVDHFPEVTAWRETAALRYPLLLTPDLRQSFQWGDEQNPHKLIVGTWTCTAMMFNHPAARQTVYALVDRYGATGSYTAEPTVARVFLMFDPYGPQTATTATMLDGRGQGVLSARAASGSMLCTHLPPTWPVGTVDHCVSYFGDLQVYRGAGWALTHPITYSGVGLDGQGTNGMLHRGIGQPKEWRGSGAVYTGPDWVFTAATSGGTILASKFYQPPPTFWYEWSRSFLWIHGDVDTVIVFDRTHLDDPLALAGCSKYPDDLEKKFNANPLRLWRWHAPIAPTIAGCTASWPIADGEVCRVSWLREDLETRITDQVVAWAGYSMAETEKKFHLDLIPEDCAGFETLITVLEFGDPAKFSTVTLHEDPEHAATAVVLTRAGRETWAALFNTTPGPTLPTYGGASAYHPEIPGLLAPVRFRDYAIPSTGARVWGMETATGLPMVEP
jgi:hypothetical protein